MCGLILAGGNMTSADMDFVGRMLIIDTFRGDHSTGVFSKFFPYNEPTVTKLVKAAVAGDEFVRSTSFMEAVCIEKRTPSKMTAGTDLVTRIFPKALFGHNRYATKGAITAQNAHPFQHGHITLAHNGTLLDQTLLPEHERFAVDSENIAYAMSVWGAERTIQNLHGSFTLIWHDAKLETLNIIRNNDREFHIAETTGGDWFGMSEEWMLKGLLGRGRAPRKIKQSFELEPGVQYVFDVSTGFKFKEEVKHELPRFPYYFPSRTSGTGWDNWAQPYGTSTSSSRSSSAQTGGWSKNGREGTQSTTKSKAETQTPLGMERYNNLMQKHGVHSLSISDKVEVEFFQFDAYSGSSLRGKACGWLPDLAEYVEVQVHGADAEEFGDVVTSATMKWVELISAYETNGVLTLIARIATPPDNVVSINDRDREELDELLSELNKEDDEDTQDYADAFDDDADLPPAEEFTASGHRFTEEAWKRSSYNCCAHCASPIPFSDIQDAYIVDGPDACFCSDCYTDIQEEVRLEMLAEEEAKAEEVQASPATFCCALCTNETPIEDVSDRASVCNECFDHYYGSTEAKTLRNGWSVNSKHWESMNSCHYCQGRIPWSQATSVRFKFENPVCKSCDGRYPLK